MKDQHGALPDPGTSAVAWQRYRRLMVWMAATAVVASIVSLIGLTWAKGPLPIHMVIGTVLGVFFSVLLAAALMGLVFLSAGSGHDDHVDDRADTDA